MTRQTDPLPGIVGSRDYPDMGQVRRYVRRLAKLRPDAVVVSGGARGVDTVAAEEAELAGLTVTVHRADWDLLGRAAGPERNARLVADVDGLTAFWDGKSAGTLDAIRQAIRAGMTVLLNPGRAES